GRGEIAVAKEKVAFSSYYLNRILLSAKIPSFGRQDGYLFCMLADYRQIRRAFLACVVGPWTTTDAWNAGAQEDVC
ncbi:hypothetical protein OFB61_23175, partial [Escherichia coli]|nr:hypothetical protein [Escherichia coli]